LNNLNYFVRAKLKITRCFMGSSLKIKEKVIGFLDLVGLVRANYLLDPINFSSLSMTIQKYVYFFETCHFILILLHCYPRGFLLSLKSNSDPQHCPEFFIIKLKPWPLVT